MFPFGPRKRRYRVTLNGSHIFIPAEKGLQPIVGFQATRFVRAFSPGNAAATALSRLRNEWFNGPYSTADRSSGPLFSIEQVELITNPFQRSKPNRGYNFIHGDEPDGKSGARG